MVLEYELQQKRDHRNQQFIKGMGFVNELQGASKVFLKGETDEATNHGPEVNNPFPEILDKSRYPVYLPNGDVLVLHNEQEICDFINTQRQEGFPLDVNPKWGWGVDETGHLTVPETKFDWTEVHNALRAQQIQMEELESQEKEDDRILVKSERLTVQHTDDIRIMAMKVDIEKLKLEPEIIYSPTLNNTGQVPKESEKEKILDYKSKH